MADITRAVELVRTIDGDPGLRAAIQAAPTVGAKREVLDGRGFADVGLDDMRAFVESKGGTLNVPEAGQELSEQELAAVSGGLTDAELGVAIGVPIAIVWAAAVAV